MVETTRKWMLWIRSITYKIPFVGGRSFAIGNGACDFYIASSILHLDMRLWFFGLYLPGINV
ncbi:hypothetical protein ESY86_15205 [Subsaximicrobium wynnwilliamsii]|uniref:Uncharacterized protein n=1 Tax=Subsaximicrobium wynnwilliamsii TaxID=291179 RepID=A0A5C6ZDZ4_9FLAO|nr:hypothetical protein [Subsaximicrobium wynnwilliamsii]TXD82180.1 hypothetical protein ESY87_14795 [Subsaximicrobium wynnwilliamsii]TXD87820.1 hypothetical protein ESY86_15205 [Subsaximicrobium wynnwilliamsii]TXE01770.1 hypothetical protein ESY88_14370 [Subsaximicrobium wynnwilliamsii]